MGKIQDVTVRQSFGQRLMNTGDLLLESAGESGAMGIQNLDNPREIADGILSVFRRNRSARFKVARDMGQAAAEAAGPAYFG